MQKSQELLRAAEKEEISSERELEIGQREAGRRRNTETSWGGHRDTQEWGQREPEGGGLCHSLEW